MHTGQVNGDSRLASGLAAAPRALRTAAPVISCTNVYKSYAHSDKPVAALQGVDLRIDEPGFYAIMGASGSGKSTLMHLMAALDQPDQGSVRVAGQDLHDLTERELTLFRRNRIGIVFQQFNLIPTLTARENVELPGMLAGDSAASLNARSTQLLEAMGVSARANHRPDALSGGEQQRVAICRALLYSPQVLLADEPTGNLDSKSSDKLWTLLGEIARTQDMTIVMVTHEPAAAVHCRRVFVLQDGRVKGELDVEGLDVSGVATRYQQLVSAA